MFSESSTGGWAVLQLSCCISKQGEHSENILQNLFHNPTTQTVDTDLSQLSRYIPARGENVIGVVVGKGGDTFRVDIGSADNASLSFMAFEGATKKNKPNVTVGDVVYAKLLVASRDMEPELVCVDSYGKKGRDSHVYNFFTINQT